MKGMVGMKWFIYFIFIILYLGVTVFGLGPVLLADGVIEERIMTFFIVLIIYLALTGLLLYWKKSGKR
jgi:hypothetical protein